MHLSKISSAILLFGLTAPAADWVRLETRPGFTLTADGNRVREGAPTGEASQFWTAEADGAWRSVADPARCLAFEQSFGASLGLSACVLPLVLRGADARGLGLTPVLAAVDTGNRERVLALYNQNFKAPNPPAVGFTGNAANCIAGSTSAAFQTAVLARVNFYRAMAGLPDAALDANFSDIAQAAALLQSANSALSHNPPATWKCFSARGADGAAKSNLALGTTGWDSITAYVDEDGNLGHRRWVLSSKLSLIGTGDVPPGPGQAAANALYVLGPGTARDGAALRDGFVAWPPKGFLPYTLAYGTWSFAVPGADFSAAAVAMWDQQGKQVTLNKTGEIQRGFGDNTIAFEPALANQLPDGGKLGPRPTPGSDLSFAVRVSNVLVGGTPRDFNYTVTLVDLNDPITDIVMTERAASSEIPPGTLVETFTVNDPNPDPNPQVTYTLVNGAGADDNAAFTLVGNELRSLNTIDFTQKSGWRIRVRANTGRANGVVEKAFVVCPFGHPTIE